MLQIRYEMLCPWDPACSISVLGRRRRRRRRRRVYIRGRKTNIVKLYPRQTDRRTAAARSAGIVRPVPVCFALPATGRMERLPLRESALSLDSSLRKKIVAARTLNLKPNHVTASCKSAMYLFNMVGSASLAVAAIVDEKSSCVYISIWQQMAPHSAA